MSVAPPKHHGLSEALLRADPGYYFPRCLLYHFYPFNHYTIYPNGFCSLISSVFDLDRSDFFTYEFLKCIFNTFSDFLKPLFIYYKAETLPLLIHLCIKTIRGVLILYMMCDIYLAGVIPGLKQPVVPSPPTTLYYNHLLYHLHPRILSEHSLLNHLIRIILLCVQP